MTLGSLLTQALTPATWHWSLDKLPSLDGKVVVVTGAAAGLGYITALELARKGAHVFVLDRSVELSASAVEKIIAATGNTKVEPLAADFTDLASVEAAADEFLKRDLKLDVLVNNVGMGQDTWAGMSKQGIEVHFSINHFGPAVFTVRLLPALKKAPSARIVNLASWAHETSYPEGIRYDTFNDQAAYELDSEKYASPVAKVRYAETKLANMHFTFELQRRLEAAGINNIYVNALHPGVVKTNIFHKTNQSSLFWMFMNNAMISPENGALTQIYVAADPEIETKQYRGRYFVPYAALAEPSPQAKDLALNAKTWEWTERILQQHYRSDWSWGL